MKTSLRIPILLAVVLLLCQCAKKESEDKQAMADRSFDYLMALNYPDAEKLPSGMYIEWLKPKSGGTAVEKDKWLLLNYKGTNFKSQVFSTRYEDEAIHEGTFTYRTRYSPHFLKFASDIVLSPGEIEALSMMSAGDSVRLYIPTKLGFQHSSIKFRYGYEGWLNSTANPNAVANVNDIPVIVELSLKDVIEDPKTYEFHAMLSKAVELGFNISLASDDKVTDSLYFRYTKPVDTTKGFVGATDTVYITYTGRFLDNFVLKTNDREIGRNVLMDRQNSFVPLSYSISEPGNLSEEAVKKVIRNGLVRYDSEFQIIFTSVWGHGTEGVEASSTNPVVYPYTPLYFDIKTYPKGYDPDAE